MPLVLLLLLLPLAAFAQTNPIHVTYLWHMHQPIYYPYESVADTENNGRFNFSIRGVHDSRRGPYGEWPKNAVQQGLDLPSAGVQVSFSGSLMENMANLYGKYTWQGDYRHARNTLRTIRNNPRLDLVGIAYHHSLMPLTTKEAMRMQVRLHKEAYKDVWDTGGSYSKGFWPPECAFDVNMIPALVDEGIQWVIVDNGHFDRACEGYPWAPESSVRPNKADQLNPDPATLGSQWVQLNNVWAPTKVSAPWGYQPRFVQYIDPSSDPANPNVKKIIAVPAGRYEGNENARGGYGAFKPENVWGSNVAVNNAPQRPMLILCHSDGDNFGMLNADAYNGQHGNFLNMTRNNPNFKHTSVQDYLELYPVPANDIIHVEPGSWVGIDGGTPYYDKWRENNPRDSEHPDLWSWSVLVAAANRVIHADNLESSYSMNDVRWGIVSDTAKAWRFYLQAETSCHWYWDFDRANPWDGNASRGANLAIAEANKVINRSPGTDRVGPTIWPPQRNIWNPGGKHFNEAQNQPSDFTVFTFVDDVSGLQSVKLYWRTDNDGENPINEYDNELYAVNPAKTSAWNIVDMTGDWYPTVKGPVVPDPANRAMRYRAPINGQNNVLIDYFVESTDTKGNRARSDIDQVWVGSNTVGGGGGGGGNGTSSPVTLVPSIPIAGQSLTVTYSGSLASGASVNIHHGFNGANWTALPGVAMTKNGSVWNFTYTVPGNATTIAMVFNNGGSNWDNNSNTNWNFNVSNQPPGGAPSTPAGVTASAVSSNRVNLTWTAVAGATSYSVRRDGVFVGNSTSTNFSDTTVQPGTTYSYTVLASNAAGNSSASIPVSATTPARPPETPPFALEGKNAPGYLLTSPGMKLHAAIRGTKLYVATWFASQQNANDHFIFVSDSLLPAATANIASSWNKAGRIAIDPAKPYLAQESSNGWAGWTNAPGNSTASASSSGNTLEGVLDLAQAFGSVPTTLHIAVAAIQTADAGALASQAPSAKNQNGDIEPGEFLSIPTAALRDSHGDGKLDRLDPRRGLRVEGVERPSGANSYALTVPAVPGIRYQVQAKNSLSDTQWTNVGEAVEAVSGTVTLSGNNTSQTGSAVFYRVQATQ